MKIGIVDQDKISLKPLYTEFQNYKLRDLQKDVFAAIAIMLISIPQAIAYSIVAGLPTYCGVFSTILGTSLCALLGSSRHLVIGPAVAITLLVQTAAQGIFTKYYPGASGVLRDQLSLEIAAMLALLIGLFQLFAAVFQFSRVIKFVSFSVVLGYISGAALALSIDQLFNFFGIDHPIGVMSIYEKASWFLFSLKNTHIVSTLVGLLSFFLLTMLKKIDLKIPSTLIMVFIVTLLVHVFDLTSIQDAAGRSLALVTDGGVVDRIIPDIHIPKIFELKILNDIVPSAFAIALIGMLETTAIAKNIAARTGQRLFNNQEIFGLGIANTILSFFGTLPCSGSSTRTIVNYESGAVSRMSAILSSLFFAIFIIYFGQFIAYIPLPTLAALIIATCVRMIDKSRIKQCLYTTKPDALVLFVTITSCIFFDLKLAFYIGSTLSILLYLRKAATPNFVEYGFNEKSSEINPLTRTDAAIKKAIRIINVEGDLFFGAADFFESTMRSMADDDTTTKVIILRLKHVRELDLTAIVALKQLHDFLQKSDKFLIVSSIPENVSAAFQRSGIDKDLGRENLFVLDENAPRKCITAAIERAKELRARAMVRDPI